MTELGKLGILVGGGPAPGINSVIAAAAIRAGYDGIEVVGIRDGFHWLMAGEAGRAVALSREVVAAEQARGGSMLRTSRANPTRDPEHLARTVATLAAMGVDKLVTIGGDDTAYSAFRVARAAGEAGHELAVVHVPKTIDNDLDLPHYVDTFGYQTARHLGTELVKVIMTDAQTTSRWYFVVSMGRKAGHLALGIGAAAGAAVTLIAEEWPEEKIRLASVVDTLVGSILKRRAAGRPDGVAVIAEGIVERLEPADLEVLEDVERDAHGNIRIAEVAIGDLLKRRVRQELAELGIGLTIVAKDIGYELRCADPIAFDLAYCRQLGYAAASELLGGGSEVMVSVQAGEIVPIPFEDLLDPDTGRARVRFVDTSSLPALVARRYMDRLRPEDLSDEDRLARLAGTAGLGPDEFRARFAPVVAGS
jgi:6-phosphofructokinase 1